MIKICVVEDERSLSDMIRMNLEIEGYTVEIFNDGQEAFEKAQEIGQFNLVLLDVMLPKVSGLDICDEIRKTSKVPILFLSAKGTTADKIAGLKKGGNDYLSKPFDLEELLLRVQILLQTASPLNATTETALIIGNKSVDYTNFEVEDKNTGETLRLSKREIDLLQFFAENEGRVVSRDEILDKIWGKEQFPTTRTIDNYILSFRKLFEDDPKNPHYFHSIRSVGYKFTND
ncbi:MAG: response regulator transcription factor [Crocinitomicaceae bacterium]|jgi:two-component system, OmpR family, alkaline phosphatase synthesis response regulator PhoP|nr:response regulator transcription factor [Crocinitomicaceae bacterium]MDP4760633.1 response regulator transcription factor [Crocinitomicaceae bacterium]MDP4866698.1 response regulator transcription factor [Crocinitomicaceae bacterium]MDP5011831.1 response regulator transcription factor [Crocinitomicaceae bacterium]